MEIINRMISDAWAINFILLPGAVAVLILIGLVAEIITDIRKS